MPILKVLLVLLLIVFPFGELIRLNLGNDIYLKPIDIISTLLFFWIFILYIKEKAWRASLRWYFFLFPFIGFLSLILNSYWLKPTEIVTSFLYLLRWVSYLSIFFTIIQVDKNFRDKIKWFLYLDGLMIVIIGYIQFFFYPGLQNLFYQGWDNQLYRMFSTFLDPNFVGAFYVLYLIFLLGLFFDSLNNRKKIIFHGIVLLLTLFAIFLTYSRSALIMLVVSGAVFFILKQKKKLILYLLCIIILFVIIASPFFYIDNLNLFRVHSAVSRIGDIRNGITVFTDHPLIGVGFDTFRYAQIKYHFAVANSPYPSHNSAGTDNSFVFILATTGIFGLAVYLNLWYQLSKKAWKSKNNNSLIFLSSTIGLFINAFFNNSLFYAEIMVWMWLITSFLFEKN
jgi:O-antigen ligase